MEFLISQELPNTEFLPMMAPPRMNAQWRISAPWSIMHGAPMYALSKIFASFAIHTLVRGEGVAEFYDELFNALECFPRICELRKVLACDGMRKVKKV